ncbi:MAG: hypothetical protein HOL08_07980 [Opitutae bacterium]|jgi:hypothetical protein|nr:hypothetical protein [Opitutae bacterium]
MAEPKSSFLLKRRSVGYLQNRLNDIPDQNLFFALFLIGAGGILVLKSTGMDHRLVVILPVFLMFAYAGMAFWTKRYRLREDKVGDNIYYLGFLYTLTSLAFALYTFANAESPAEKIISDFGIAIATTIVGLVGRVFFNQMREDPIEYEREARSSLAEATNEMRSQLGDIVTEASIFKQKLSQVLEEAVLEVAGVASASMNDIQAKFTSNGEEVLMAIRRAFGEFSENASRLNNISSKNVTAIQNLIEKIDGVTVAPDMLEKRLDFVTQKYDQAAQQALERNKLYLNDLKNLRKIIKTSEIASNSFEHQLQKVDEGIVDKLSELNKSLQDCISSSARLSKTMENSTKKMTEDLAVASDVGGDLYALMATQAEGALEVGAGLETVMQKYLKTAEGMRKEIENELKQLVNASNRLLEQGNITPKPTSENPDGTKPPTAVESVSGDD